MRILLGGMGFEVMGRDPRRKYSLIRRTWWSVTGRFVVELGEESSVVWYTDVD